jgi:hypothetical protein
VVTLTWLLVGLVSVTLLLVVWYRGERRLRQEREEWGEKIRWRTKDVLDSSRRSEEEHAARLDADRRYSELQAMVSGILGERDSWRDLYQLQSSQHCAAQAWLMREREKLVFQLKAKGIVPAVDPLLDRVVDEFRGTHSATGQPGPKNQQVGGSAPGVSHA